MTLRPATRRFTGFVANPDGAFDAWGWFEHSGYSPIAHAQTLGTEDAQLLMTDTANVFFFDPFAQTDEMADIQVELETQHVRFVCGALRGWGVSTEGEGMLAASLYMDGNAVRSYANIMSDKQYPAPAASVIDTHLSFRSMET